MISLLLLLTSLSDHARAAEPLVLIAERNAIGGGLEQMAVVFEADLVRTTNNANFLGEKIDRKGAVRLGHLKSSMNPLLELEKRRLASMAKELSRKPAVQAPPEEGSHHQLRLRLNGTPVSPASSFYQAILSTFERVQIRGKWTALDSVTIEHPGPSAKASWEGSGKRPAPIRPRCDAGGRCRIPGYGVAYFR